MSKQQTPKPTDTAAVLSAAEKSRALEESKLAEADFNFEQLQTAEAFQHVQTARQNLELATHLHRFALAAHEKFEGEKAASERAEAERIRQAALSEIAADGDKILAEATAAAQTISKCWAKSWANRIAEQGYGGPGLDGFAAGLRMAFWTSLSEAGLAPQSIEVRY
jgi:hypothetical protein